MNLLYFAKAKEDVLRGDRVREGVIAAVVDERDGEFLDALWATMIIKRGQTSNIEQPNFAGTSKAFFVAGAGRMDEPQHKRYLAFVVAGAVRMDDPPHDRYLGTWVCRARTVRSIKTDMAIGIVWAPTVESRQVDSGGITPEGCERGHLPESACPGAHQRPAGRPYHGKGGPRRGKRSPLER